MVLGSLGCVIYTVIQRFCYFLSHAEFNFLLHADFKTFFGLIAMCLIRTVNMCSVSNLVYVGVHAM